MKHHFHQSHDGFLCVRKHAITHPKLTSLPYRHTIEDWVSSDFPHASYYCSSRPAVNAINLHDAGITAIQGAKGLGKSKAIAASIRATPDATVLFVTFNCALAWASLDILGEHGKLYSDISGCIVPDAHPRVCLVVNSIHRVEPGYDIVVIDEIVSVMTNLSGDLLTNAVRTAVLKAWVKIIRAAKCIIVADAMLDAACLRFLLMCRSDTLPMQVFDYTHRVHRHYRYMAHAYKDTWEQVLDYALKSGKNVAVASMTIPMVQNLRARYGGMYKTISYVAGDDPSILATHMLEGIDAHWRNCQLLIYSPVITAGCSFEMRHFDLLFFYGRSSLASARTANQMISRIRDIAMQTVHVHILDKSSVGYDPVDDDADADTDDTDAGTSSEVGAISVTAFAKEEDKHMLLLHELTLFAEKERRLSLKAFSHTFWSFVVFSGATIHFQRSDLLSSIPESLRLSTNSTRRVDGLPGDEILVKFDSITHCWDSEVHLKTPRIRALSGQTLQRAGMWHSEQACAMGVFDGITVRVLPSRVSRIKHSKNARSRAWDLLVAQNTISRQRSEETSDCVKSARKSRFSMNNTRVRAGSKIVFPGITEKYATELQLADEDPIVKACFAGEVDLNDDARLDGFWLIAAVDVTVRARSPYLAPKLLLEPRPEDLDVIRAKTIEQAVIMAVFNNKDCEEYWIGVNVVLGVAMVADVVIVHPETKALHIYMFRASGRAALVYDFDALKGLALCTAATVPFAGLTCESVNFLYLKTFETVEMDVSRWAPASRRCFINFVETKGRLPEWNALCSVVLVYFDGAGGAMSARFPDGRTVVFKTVDEVFQGVSEFAVGSFVKLVSWGFRDVFHEKYARRVFDLEYIIADRVGCDFDVEPTQMATATIKNARPLSEPCNDNDSIPGIDKVYVLYRSIIQKGAVVYFKNSVPTSVDVYSLNSVAFLQAQGKPVRFIETHTL